jgi:hypothetical protein
MRDLVLLARVAIDVQVLDRAHRFSGDHLEGGQQQAGEQAGRR